MQQTAANGMQSQKLEIAAQLAAGMAHEINTPVQYIGDNLRFLKDAFAEMFAMLRAAQHSPEGIKDLSQPGEFDFGYMEEEVPQAIEQALEGVSRVAKLVSAMQAFSRPDTGKKVAINLNHAIESVLLVARNEWKYVAEMKLDLESALPPVAGYAGEMNQVVYSLIVHAAHAMGGTVQAGSGLGSIMVSTRRVRAGVELRIEHTGVLAVDPRNHPLSKHGSLADEYPGLKIARSVVMDRHQGTLDFETDEVQGGRFILRLPCCWPS